MVKSPGFHFETLKGSGPGTTFITLEFQYSFLILYILNNKPQWPEMYPGFLFFYLSGFSIIDTGKSQDSSGREGLFFLFTNFTRSRLLRHLFATFHVR